MLNIKNLTKQYGKRKLFDNINQSLDVGKRYGLIGANGAGKSTLVKIMGGEEDSTSGEIQLQNGLKMGVLGQNQYAYEEFTLKDAVLKGNQRLFDAIKEKEALYEAGDFSDKVNDRLGILEMVCVEEDPMYEAEVRIEKLLENLGFEASMQNDKMSSISNANKFKILLAQVLFPKPDVLLLDEPTNNLDIETISWLENELKNHEGTMLIISHDRHFLNSVVTHILDLDFGTLREFKGTYDDWYIAANVIQKQNELDRGKKLKEKKELESFVARFSANASKAKQATSRQKQLDKLDIGAIQVSTRRNPNIVFNKSRDVGKVILEIENLSKSYDDVKVYDNYDFKVEKDDKIAIIGSNGVGKTTFLELITKNISADSGTIKWGETISHSYFPQNTTEMITGEDKLYDWVQGFNPKWHIDDIRKALGRMLFSGEDQDKKVSALSGGEKHRMMISKMMMESSNFIIFDEPDNHLDLEAIIALGESLYNYEANVICVTHDRELIDAFANRIIEIKNDGTITDFKGSYEEYKEVNE
ncbi:MAG: ABC transporter ATP-binding protein uup [uncultured Campylobacterales bacterium]|uniref:Probable ATP-binding protein YbiT n=1 Tax=uncultured Campylobacterales bacterium TaxID=352960 RepID=A0A6S6S1H2_9BACT|nr:MAG: ABC transporter ATP-binding protein uup [uncultured Campylobacterales bacterium]